MRTQMPSVLRKFEIGVVAGFFLLSVGAYFDEGLRIGLWGYVIWAITFDCGFRAGVKFSKD